LYAERKQNKTETINSEINTLSQKLWNLKQQDIAQYSNMYTKAKAHTLPVMLDYIGSYGAEVAIKSYELSE